MLFIVRKNDMKYLSGRCKEFQKETERIIASRITRTVRPFAKGRDCLSEAVPKYCYSSSNAPV